MNKDLIIMRRTPLDVDVAMFEHFAEYCWDGRITVYAETSFGNERLKCNYPQSALGINTLIADESNLVFDDLFFRTYSNCFFLFYGFPMAKKYETYIKKYRLKFGIITERVVSFVNSCDIKTQLRKAFPLIQYHQNKYIIDNASCVLAMGKPGVDCFKKYYKCRDEVLFDFMYNDGNKPLKYKEYKFDDPVKFVYVGRFDYMYKGLDVLINALETIDASFSFDLIGNYGTNAAEVRNRIKNIPNVSILDPYDREKLCSFLNKYDVIVVPSKADGWNLHCNLSINAGLGIITTDQAGSQELIEFCQNGVIIPANNVDALVSSMIGIINDPNIINQWKKRTSSFTERISYITVANYLKDILVYSISRETYKPDCPWININNVG